MSPNKNCSICVYNGPCVDRKDHLEIKDCCIVEAPLRKIQRSALKMGVELFIHETHKYIHKAKSESYYWRKTLSIR